MIPSKTAGCWLILVYDKDLKDEFESYRDRLQYETDEEALKSLMERRD